MLTAVQLLAVNNFGDTRSGGLAGPMGLFLIILLSIATVLLIRNMNARLRRLPEHFPERRADAGVNSIVLDPTDVTPAGDPAGGTSSQADLRGNGKADT